MNLTVEFLEAEQQDSGSPLRCGRNDALFGVSMSRLQPVVS